MPNLKNLLCYRAVLSKPIRDLRSESPSHAEGVTHSDPKIILIISMGMLRIVLSATQKIICFSRLS